MSYNTQARMAIDSDLRLRIAACAATQGELLPVEWADANQWSLSAAPGWDAAYSYSLQLNEAIPDYRSGKDESVITDAMILAEVQPRILAETTEPITEPTTETTTEEPVV